MVRIIGNSPERVPIKDLDDIIYYRQIKDFTDDEYKNSRDLKKAINSGKVSKIEESKSPRGSSEIPGHGKNQESPINIKDLKAILREVLPKNNGSSDIAQAVREIGPLIADMVRQEMSKISIVGTAQPAVSASLINSAFKGPEYIPDVNTEGMISNVEADERTASADEVDENLAALRQLQNKSKSK
jgi:hypothetical protein